MLGEEVPLRPVSRQDIHRLEAALLIATLFRPDVLEEIQKAEERLTWVDSLAVAAGALAREKAGMHVSRIADELGRTETTIRNHLKGKTKAGQLVRETYEKFLREGFKIELPEAIARVLPVEVEDVGKLKEKLEEAERKIEELKGKIKILEGKIDKIKKILLE